MATMTIRTTVAFDLATVARWERLTRRWGTSKSETLRRALEAADRESTPSSSDVADFRGMTPQEILLWIESNPLVPAGSGEQWTAEIRAEREAEADRSEKRAALNLASQPPNRR